LNHVKSSLTNTLILTLALAGAPVLLAQPVKNAPAKPADKPAPEKSAFTMPTNPHEGRDPFFPESMRPYEDSPASQKRIEETTFTVRGLSVENGRAMVIINNHTFAIGDEGDVLSGGRRVHIRLAEIRPNAVIIEANGVRREIIIPVK
jgi:hypothetical protein